MNEHEHVVSESAALGNRSWGSYGVGIQGKLPIQTIDGIIHSLQSTIHSGHSLYKGWVADTRKPGQTRTDARPRTNGTPKTPHELTITMTGWV